MRPQAVTPVWDDDDRAVAPVIGVVILFGFLILTLSVYQVQVVPQQNAEVEFQHFEDVRNDLVELRASILQAGSIDQPQYQTVQLGTSYPTRVFSINPPAPAGTIRTTQSYPITISNGSGTPNGTITVPTRFIQYRPGYNELDQTPTWYDASVLYVDARGEGGGISVIEDQALVESGDVQITAVQREFQRSGTGRVTLELRPAENVTGEIPTGDLTVTIPTRLNASDWENKTNLPTDSSVYGGVTDTGNDGVGGFNIYNLTLNTTPERLTVDTVGVQQDPDEPTQNNNARVGGGAGSDGETGGGVGENFLVTYNQLNNDNVRLTFRNENGFEVDVARIRLDSYTDASGGNNQINGLQFLDGDTDPVLTEGGQFRDVTLSPFSSGESQDYTFAPQRPSGKPKVKSGDEFTITIEFKNGDRQSYDISVP